MIALEVLGSVGKCAFQPVLVWYHLSFISICGSISRISHFWDQIWVSIMRTSHFFETNGVWYMIHDNFLVSIWFRMVLTQIINWIQKESQLEIVTHQISLFNWCYSFDTHTWVLWYHYWCWILIAYIHLIYAWPRSVSTTLCNAMAMSWHLQQSPISCCHKLLVYILVLSN